MAARGSTLHAESTDRRRTSSNSSKPRSRFWTRRSWARTTRPICSGRTPRGRALSSRICNPSPRCRLISPVAAQLSLAENDRAREPDSRPRFVCESRDRARRNRGRERRTHHHRRGSAGIAADTRSRRKFRSRTILFICPVTAGGTRRLDDFQQSFVRTKSRARRANHLRRHARNSRRAKN